MKEYKYGPTKVKICQDIEAHDHHKRHPLNVMFHQYNEFVKLVLKNKNGPVPKVNNQYLFGLARALGMNLKKDAFAENNMKTREHITYLKEKLIYCFYKKLDE